MSLFSFLSNFAFLVFIKIYSYILYKPEIQKFYESCHVLFLGDVSNDFAKFHVRGVGGMSQFIGTLYNRAKQAKVPLAGCVIVGQKTLILRDPAILKQILVKDAANFDRANSMLNFKGDYLVSKTLVFLQDDEWKNLRAKLDSAFTPSKVKRNFSHVDKLGKNLVEYLNREVELMKDGRVNFKLSSHKYTLDVAASVSLNLDTGCLHSQKPSVFERISNRVQTYDNWLDAIQIFFVQWFPRISAYFRFSIIDREIAKFYDHLAESKIENSRGTQRDAETFKSKNDFVDLVYSSRKELYTDGVDNQDGQDFITANLFGMVLPGYETSEVTLSSCVYHLALNSDIQIKLWDEVNHVIQGNGGQLTFDGVNQMEYLNAVVNETLRICPPVGILVRTCKTKYHLPGTRLVLNPGDMVLVSQTGLHHDEEYYEKPGEFNPDRFLGENKGTIDPFAFLPFGQGPRICIGTRMGVLQVKLAICHILLNFKLEPCLDTNVPIKFKKTMAPIIQPESVMLSFAQI